MRPTAHAAADRFLRSPRSARPYVMGLAIAAAALATPASADVLQDGLRAAVTLWPAADPIQTVSSYFDGSMTLVASALRGVAKIASGQGVELIHPAREAARDAAVWLGLREPEAQTFFEVTLSKSAEFPAFAKNFCGERLAQGPVQVGMDFGAALAALSGAWEGLKLLRRGYDRILGRSPTRETPTARIEINLSLSGDRAGEFLQRSGLLDAARAETAPAPRSLAPAPCDCDKPDAAELVTRAEMRAWENASLIRSASAQAGGSQARISAAGHPAEGLVARRGAPTHDWLRNAFKPLPEGLQDLVSASRAARPHPAGQRQPPPLRADLTSHQKDPILSKPIIIGLTGKRQAGKSHLADHLVERHGFRRIHPFEGGKAATEAYFVHIGADEDTAHRMVFGDLKDKPSALLPGGVAPRFFMEEFGKFMGTVLGPDWTIGREILRETALAEAEGLTSPRFIVESVVYEVETLRRAGGVVIKVDRPTSGIDGQKSDAFVATIVPDHLIMNTWETLAPLYAEGDRIVEGILANHRAMESLLEDEREPAPC